MKSENKNFLYNCIYQIFTFIIPLITTPYISRVLGVENIGIYSYTYSIVYCFMLATLLGINNYGSREISKIMIKNNKEKTSERFCSIYYMQLILGIVMLVIYTIFVMLFLKKFENIFLIQGIFILSSMIDINWFFFGMEKFKITISRNIIIKLLSLILIFLLVKGKDDLVIYTFILSISTLFSQVYLWLYLKKFVRLKKVSIKNIYANLKPCLILFVPVIAYSIYRVMDKTMLGSISGVTALGYYENAEKVINIPIAFINALGTVMLPNTSRIEDDGILVKKIYDSFYLVLLFIVPMFFVLLGVAKDFSVIFFGEEFIESGNVIEFLAITIIFSAITSVIRNNYLIPKRKDTVYVKSTIIGAIVNLIINLILIPRLNYYGACIGTILAEFSVMIYQILIIRKEISFVKVLKMLIEHFIKGIMIFISVIVIGFLFEDIQMKLIFQILISIILFLLFNYKYIIYDFFSLKRI